MGMVYKRNHTWWIKFYAAGRPVRESSHSAKEGDARRLLRLREGDVERGVPISPRVGRLRFDEAITDLLTDYKVNGKRSHEILVGKVKKHLAPRFTGRRLASITTADLRSYIAERQKEGAANATINRELAAIRRAFRLAMQAGKLISEPYVPMLRENGPRKGFFEERQFVAVRSYLPEPLKPLVTFAYITGWRIPSEVPRLQWRHVDFAGLEVRLDPEMTKSREGRVFPMTAELRSLLEAQREVTRTVERDRGMVVPWVFHRNGDRIRNFRGAWRAACERAGCPGRLLHDFRRTSIRNLVRAGIPERVAMEMCGHRTRSVFDRYNIVSTGDFRDAARKLDAARAQ